MWKESYRIGIESIDLQHQKLFQMTEELLKAIEEKKEPETYRNAIRFLKEYVVVHFRDEEAYQASIQYSGRAEHIKQHRAFTETVLSFERELERSSYDLSIVKELAGTLTAWLIYHVADADQKIAGKNLELQETGADSYIDFLGDSIRQVLEKIAGLKYSDVSTEKGVFKQIKDDVVITVDIIGDSQDRIVFGFSKKFAVKLFETMTFMVTEEVDELVCSALAELSNIICGNMSVILSKRGVNIDIKTPVFVSGNSSESKEMEGMRVTTNLGGLEAAVSAENADS